MHGGVYKRRTPEKSDLYRIAYQHFEKYEKVYPERYEEEYGYFRKIITATICKYLDCGVMEDGFARVRCPDCGYDFFVSFSCKTRFFCPSCSEKRTLIWGAWVKENVLKNVAHRQWVFTIPKVLRKLFYKDRLLLAELARCAAATILELYREIFPDNHFRPGIIASTQTFGELIFLSWSALPSRLPGAAGKNAAGFLQKILAFMRLSGFICRTKGAYHSFPLPPASQ